MEKQKNKKKLGFDYKDIDPNIRPLVTILNENNFITLFSCAGHDGQEGYVTINGKIQKLRLQELLDKIKSCGITNCDPPEYTTESCTTIRFKGLGGSRGMRIIPKFELSIPYKEKKLISRYFSRNLSRIGIHHLSSEHCLIMNALILALNGEEIQKESN